MKVGDLRNGFQVVSVEKLRDVDATLWRMNFVKNGADLIWLERKDEVKTFLIGFKTLPKDDTGVAHILEHSVLCGSEKYPVKSPFNEMRKSSPCSFMNAMTARDFTYYPFSSRYDGDFLNLLDVYLDAVFYPLVIKDPKIFQQEGWHYEYNSTDGTLFCNGVVLNEMKGVFAEPERRASREVLRWLYPDVVYGNDSGGTPEAIPTLSFQDFCQFYKTYYHPSNSFIFLDGDIKLDEVLTRLENVLKNYSHRGNRFEIPIQSPIECKKSFNYNASNSSATTFLVEGWSVGTFKDYVDFLALDLIAKYLCETNEAPLKKLLLEKGVCDDVAFWGDQFQQNSFCFLFRNLHSETALVDELILGFLRDLVEEGFDKSRLTALIDNYEFSIRESIFMHKILF